MREFVRRRFLLLVFCILLTSMLDKIYRKMMQKLPYPVMIHYDDGQIIEVNEAWSTVNVQEEIDGKTVKDWINSIENWKDNDERGIKIDVNTKSGDKGFWNFRSIVLGKDENNNKIIMSVARDITNRKKLRILLEESRDHYKKLVQGSFETILIYDIEQEVISDYNEYALEIFGEKLEKGSISILDLSAKRSDQTGGKLKEKLDQLEEKGFLRFNWDIINKFGNVIETEIRLVRFTSNKRDLIRVMIMDVSDMKETERKLKKLNQELRRSNKDLEQFAYIASHDLQEPLRIIHGFVELIEKDYTDTFDDEGSYMINAIKRATIRMQRLIDDLLKFSRLGRNQNYEEVDLNDVVLLVKQNLQTELNNKNVSLIIEELPTITANYTEMSQLFQNLISNSVKFNRNTPEITIKYDKHEDTHHFQIIDNGMGIDKEYYEEIFTIFKRLQNNREFTGSGLGLALCKKIVESLGGKIWVGSRDDDKSGTVFHITIPNRS